jgi:hypothetical protein
MLENVSKSSGLLKLTKAELMFQSCVKIQFRLANNEYGMGA